MFPLRVNSQMNADALSLYACDDVRIKVIKILGERSENIRKIQISCFSTFRQLVWKSGTIYIDEEIGQKLLQGDNAINRHFGGVSDFRNIPIVVRSPFST